MTNLPFFLSLDLSLEDPELEELELELLLELLELRDEPLKLEELDRFLRSRRSRLRLLRPRAFFFSGESSELELDGELLLVGIVADVDVDVDLETD